MSTPATEVALSSNFKDVMREKILAAFVDLIPQEQFDKMLEAEIKAFFETPDFLTIQQTTLEVPNPRYNPTDRWSEPNLKKECFVFGNKMTPFRQMVWTVLHNELTPKIKTIVDDEKSQTNVALEAWLKEQAMPQLKESNTSLFTHLALGMSALMMRNTLSEAIHTSHSNLLMAWQSAGMDISKINVTPYVPQERTFN